MEQIPSACYVNLQLSRLGLNQGVKKQPKKQTAKPPLPEADIT